MMSQVNYRKTPETKGMGMEEKWHYDINNLDQAMMIESASANTHANARSLGKLAAFMANGGTLNG